MDSLLVDLDKVLDDFEAEENLAPGSETKPSGYQQYLEQANKQTWRTIEHNEFYNECNNRNYENNSQDVPDSDLTSVRYDFPYEPETFDLSEADFAPSPNFGDSGYNGSLSYAESKDAKTETKLSTLKQSIKDQSLSAYHMNGNISENDSSDVNSVSHSGLDLQKVVSSSDDIVTQTGLPYSAQTFTTQAASHYTQSKATETKPGSLRFPIQADVSPGQLDSSKMAFLTNGHSSSDVGTKSKTEQSEKPVYQSQLSGIPSLDSINSNPDYNKYPVQCNTPQTPKDNPLANPFVSQMSEGSVKNASVRTHSSSSQYSHSASDKAMQDSLKLQNLTKELERTDDDKRKGGIDQIKATSKVTQSLPAYLQSQSGLHHGYNASSSLPPELENDVQSEIVAPSLSKTETKDASSLSSASQAQKSWNAYLKEAYGVGKNEIPPETENAHLKSEQDKQRNAEMPLHKEDPVEDRFADTSKSTKTEPEKVVGFGNVEEDIDDPDIEAYLTEDTANQSDHASQTVAPHLQKNRYNTEYEDRSSERGNMYLNEKSNITEADTKFDEIESQSTVSNDIKVNVHLKETSKNGYSEDSDRGYRDQSDVRSKQNNNTAAPAVSDDQTVSQTGNLDLEIFKVLPKEACQTTGAVNTVISDFSNNLSPVANISLDSGCASMTDYVEDSDVTLSGRSDNVADGGARPKDLSNKVNRPNSLQGLSKVNLNSESPFVIKPAASHAEVEDRTSEVSVAERMVKELHADQMSEAKQLMENSAFSEKDNRTVGDKTEETNESDTETGDKLVELRHPDRLACTQPEGPVTGRPRSWSPSDSGQPRIQKQKRPTSLNLPPPPTIDPTADRQMSEEDQSPLAGAGVSDVTGEDGNIRGTEGSLGAEGGEDAPYIPPDLSPDPGPPPSYSSTLGHVAPKWIPDAEAPICMSCEARFTFTKRRHHCRACGKVFCSTCCSMKNRLPHLNNQEARVCVLCHSELALAERDAGRPPHPNNPSDYCSVVPPTQAASSTAPQPPPSVLVPVLKRDGHGGSEGANRQTAPKQVMFSDGIRPGGDLTELDGSSEISRVTPRRSRVQKRVERVSQGQHSPRSRRLRTVAERTTKCLIPDVGLPPLCVTGDTQGNVIQPNPSPGDFMTDVKDETKDPVIFAVNTNLYVSVKIVTLSCCVDRTVWCFTTKGMTSVGQEEIVIVLECLPDEEAPPRDMFVHLSNVYEEASRGNVITEMGHSIFNQSFLDSRDHGGFLYIRASFQCTQKLTLPRPPYLFGILLQKWETPWAKVFPLRLLLRLGAEFRYYPCPLIGIRNRKPVYFEIGHTIMNLLADFRNYQYMLPNIRGITIHMEDKVTKINFPRNRYEELMKVVNNSNEHVMAIAANFSSDADSHLVCIQNDDGNYQTQAINIQNKPRKVTGASFVVFNGALKTSSGLSAKSSIVEDGLMVQITPDSMLALKQAIKDMHDYPINCGVIGSLRPDETVVVQWVEDDKNVNIGVKSPVDGMCMDGVESLRIQHATDYIGEKNIMRWTEIFFIKNEERGSPKWDPVDLSRIGETVATACCMALTQHLEKLKESDLDRIGLRITLSADSVGYEAGAKGERLPDVYMNDLDNELIPVIHRASQPDASIVLELIFEVLE